MKNNNNNRQHKHKIKKNFPFGRKSQATKYCKICGKIITNKMIKDEAQNNNKNGGNRRR
ncbi:MAG TPA: hypothetical protein VMZ91_07155 [Candidatus Paceibacterota bacterium]|nr:hypothetical protein [Candidatus Paceibacterota bacterium]